MRDTLAWPERQLETILKIEECDSAILEFFSDDPFGLQAEPISIETNRLFKIANGESKQCYPRLHELMVASHGFRATDIRYNAVWRLNRNVRKDSRRNGSAE
jgi:hypothetical protein